MTSSKRTDSPTRAVSAAEAAVGRDEYETAELRRENEALKRQLAEAWEQQATTSEILRVISQSQRDVQPVFEAIAANARKLCMGTYATVYLFDGRLIRLSGADTGGPESLEALREAFPRPPGRDSAVGRAILTRAVAHIPDVANDAEYQLHWGAQKIGYRS